MSYQLLPYKSDEMQIPFSMESERQHIHQIFVESFHMYQQQLYNEMDGLDSFPNNEFVYLREVLLKDMSLLHLLLLKIINFLTHLSRDMVQGNWCGDKNVSCIKNHRNVILFHFTKRIFNVVCSILIIAFHPYHQSPISNI